MGVGRPAFHDHSRQMKSEMGQEQRYVLRFRDTEFLLRVKFGNQCIAGEIIQRRNDSRA